MSNLKEYLENIDWDEDRDIGDYCKSINHGEDTTEVKIKKRLEKENPKLYQEYLDKGYFR